MDSGFFPESTRLGRYQIVKRLGGGDASEVLLAVSHGPHGFERIVVLKRLLPEYESDPSIGRMLANEAVAYARLTHPAVVRLYDFFELDGHAILVLEYVDGPSLAVLRTTLDARQEVLGDPAAIYIASRVFAGLAAAHAARDPRSGEFAPVIHRDVSPGSVLLPWDGFVKLGDFGFAKVKGVTSETGDTRHGLLKGTLGYMAPEQALGEPVTPRTDVYAACLLLRELLIGVPTFQRTMPELELLKAMAETELPPIETMRGGISPMLADAMRRGLSRDPEGRTLTAAEMVRVLRQETDLALAQVSLEATLARVRPSEARASTPPTGIRAIVLTPPSGTVRFERKQLPPEARRSDTGIAGLLDSDSHPTLRVETPHAVIVTGRPPPESAFDPHSPPRPRRRGMVVAVGLVALAACVALAVLFSIPPPPIEETATTAAIDATPPPAILPPAASPAAAPAASVPRAPEPPLPSPTPASTIGSLTTPARAHSHRVFIDGKYAAPRSGATLSLHCGKHLVRIGSRGKDQPVEVPCGGSVTVDALW
jgi:eukaryotic-like serine/threonine-protein kinase